ncbi:hypothetical protein, partial [Pseudomonas helleri]|uniref:hypothetical protein n=1 Tax=Pseudomonas helleri TaxID=1608996 RepID=UPI003F9BCA1D
MDSELLVRVDYNVGRKDPAQIFEAMALYINAQRDFCQLLANSLDLDTAVAGAECNTVIELKPEH